MLLDGEKIYYGKRVLETIFYFLTSRFTIQLPRWYHQALQTHYLKLNSSSTPPPKKILFFFLKGQELSRLERPEFYPELQPQKKTRSP